MKFAQIAQKMAAKRPLRSNLFVPAFLPFAGAKSGNDRLRDPHSLYIKSGFNQGDQQLRNAFSERLEVTQNAVKSQGRSRATRALKFVAMQPLKFVSGCGKLCASARALNVTY